MLKQLQGDIIKEFDKKYSRGGFGDTEIYKEVKKYLIKSLSRQCDEIVKMIEESKKTEFVEQSHQCFINGINIGSAKYSQALSDIIDKLK